jgi:hypothetical protein
MRLTYADLLTLDRGLAALSAGKTQPDGTRKPYRLPAAAILAAAQNTINVRKALEPYHAAARDVFESMPHITVPLKDGPGRQVAPTHVREFQQQTTALLNGLVTVKLFKIKGTDLKFGDKADENDISHDTLADLDRVLDRTGLTALEEATEAEEA